MIFCEKVTKAERSDIMTRIEIKNVTKIIKHNTVIDNISLTINSGEITGLKGINGSGKTMLMRLVSGLILPTSGEISINGKVLGKDITFPHSIGTLIETPAFLDSYSGFQNLRLLASIQGKISDEEIREAIRAVELNPDDKKKYRKYSLGMKQRLGIAAAVMEHPDIIILDEPTNALDSDGVQMIKRILQKEKAHGALIMISCHNLDILKELSDVIYLMNDGKLSTYTGKEESQ